jgi:hypothetical protein
MYTASSSAFRTFATTFELLEVNFFSQEKVLQFPGHRLAVDEPDLLPDESVAEENTNYCKDMSASEGVNADTKTMKMSNLPSHPQEAES